MAREGKFDVAFVKLLWPLASNYVSGACRAALFCLLAATIADADV